MKRERGGTQRRNSIKCQEGQRERKRKEVKGKGKAESPPGDRGLLA